MKGNCETCRWWKNHHGPMWADCMLAEIGRSGIGVKHPESLAHAWSGSGNVPAGLLTHATFGCVQWERKDAT